MRIRFDMEMNPKLRDKSIVYSPFEGWMELNTALGKRDLQRFRMALQMGADYKVAGLCSKINIFETALSTAGCADFITECLLYEEDLRAVNTINKYLEKSTIHFAIDSGDPKNMEVLLKYSPSFFVDSPCDSLTPLNVLAKKANNENIDSVSNCIQQLLNYGADPNLSDDSLNTPLHNIVYNTALSEQNKKQLAYLFFKESKNNLNATHYNGDFRSLLVELGTITYYQLDIENDNEYNLFKKKICNEFENVFEIQLLFAKMHLAEGEPYTVKTLLMHAMRLRLTVASQALLNKIDDVNGDFGGETLLDVAAFMGNWRVLQQLLENESLLPTNSPLLSIPIVLMDNLTMPTSTDYKKCFYLLLNWRHININKVDKDGHSPLQYAIASCNIAAIKALLKRGAYLGCNKPKILHIVYLSADLLEEHFNDCITTNNKSTTKDFTLEIDFKNLTPPNKKDLKYIPQDMDPIHIITQSKDYRHLLNHPLITCFLFLKWRRISLIFYLNFLLYALFAISIIAYIMLNFIECNYKREFRYTCHVISLGGIAYLIMRETVQFITAPVRYFSSLTNILEIFLILLSVIISCNFTFDDKTNEIISAITILLIAFELCLLVGSLPILSISTHMLMLRAVLKSFLKSFALYSIFVVTFSFSFFILFHQSDKEPELNNFSTVYLSFIKTFVMFTGEYDAASIGIDNNYSYLIFLLFVIFMSIVLFNLLSGLAFSDTQAIKEQAELNSAICRAELLFHYEQVLRTEYTFLLTFNFVHNIYNWLKKENAIDHKVRIYPNDNNKTKVPIKNRNDSSTSFEELKPIIKCVPNCILNRFAEMDKIIVESAKAVIDKKTEFQSNKERKKYTDMRLQSVEVKIENTTKLLEDMQAVLLNQQKRS